MKLYTQRKGAISKKTELDALVQVGMFVHVKHSILYVDKNHNLNGNGVCFMSEFFRIQC